mgnify:FL=1
MAFALRSALRQLRYSYSVCPAGQAKSNEVAEHTKTVASRLQSVAKIGWRANNRVSRQLKTKREMKPIFLPSAAIAQNRCKPQANVAQNYSEETNELRAKVRLGTALLHLRSAPDVSRMTKRSRELAANLGYFILERSMIAYFICWPELCSNKNRSSTDQVWRMRELIKVKDISKVVGAKLKIKEGCKEI